MSATTPTTPEDARTLLQQGNARFLRLLQGDGGSLRQVSAPDVAELAKGQQPWAVVLGCADSRVPTEYVFDCAPGELFVVRVAGNIAQAAQIGSIEFAVTSFAPKIVLVLGHTRCGAVQAALNTDINEIESDNLAGVVATIKPALSELPDLSEPDLDSAATEANVRQSMQHLRESSVLNQAESEEVIAIVGAVYQLATGEVKFID